LRWHRNARAPKPTVPPCRWWASGAACRGFPFAGRAWRLNPPCYPLFLLEKSRTSGQGRGDMFKSLFADPYGAPSLVRWVAVDHYVRNLKGYFAAFALMVVAAAATVAMPVFFGDVVNQAYLRKNFPDLVAVCGLIVLVFALRGATSY